MTKIFTSITTLLIFYLTMHTASAQSQTNINEIMQCTLKPGYSAEEVISVGRAIPRGDNGPNIVFYREPLVADPSRAGSINVVRYWNNLEHMVSNMETNQPSGPSRHFLAMVNCQGSRVVALNRTTGSGLASPYEGMGINQSFVAMRSCQLKDDMTMSDMVERLEEADANRPAGDKSGLGIVQIIAGGVQDSSSANSSFVFRTIGENPVGLAKRLDSFDYLGRFENFPATCGNMSLWRSHVIYRNN